jgi:hypothetical protein
VRRVVIDGEPLAGFVGPEIALAAVVFKLFARELARRDGAAPSGVLALRDQLAAFTVESGAGTLASGSTGQRFVFESEIPDTALAMPEFLTAAQAAAVIGISEQAVTARCRSGSLTAARSRAGWEIDPHAAAALAERRKGA